MKRIFTPVLYALLLFPLTAAAVGAEMAAREVGLLGEYKGTIDAPLALVMGGAILVLGVPLFWMASKWISWLEKTVPPKVADHFRQSCLFYVIALVSLGSWAARGLGNREEDGYLLLWSGIALLAIAVNYRVLLLSGKRASQ